MADVRISKGAHKAKQPVEAADHAGFVTAGAVRGGVDSDDYLFGNDPTATAANALWAELKSIRL